MKTISPASLMLARARRIEANPQERDVLSRGEVVAIGLALNRPDWLAEAGFTLAEAIARLNHAEQDAVIFAARNLYNTSVI